MSKPSSNLQKRKAEVSPSRQEPKLSFVTIDNTDIEDIPKVRPRRRVRINAATVR